METVEGCERTRTVHLKTVKCGKLKKDYRKVDSLEAIIKADAKRSGLGQVRGSKLILNLDISVSKGDRQLVNDLCSKKGKDPQLVDSILKTDPNNLWAHFLKAATCHRTPGKKHLVTKGLASSVLINPNFKSAWAGLFEVYKKQGGFFKKETFHQMILVTKGILLMEDDFQKWSKYAQELVRYLSFTKREKQIKTVLDILIPFLDSTQHKSEYVAKIISYISYQNYFKEYTRAYVKAYRIHIVSIEDNERSVFFHMVSKILLLNDLAFDLCDFIVFTRDLELVSFYREMPQLAILLFEMTGRYCFRAVSKLLSFNADHYFLQDFSRHTQTSNYLNHLVCGKYSKLARYLGKQNLAYYDNRRIIYNMAIEKLGYFERLFKVLMHDLFIMKKGESVVYKWYMRRLIVLMCKTKDLIIQKLGLLCAYKYLETDFNPEILYSIGLANTSIFGQPGDFILRFLTQIGCLETAIYLKSFDSDPEQVSQSLKAIPVSLNSYILSAKMAIEQNKRNKVKMNMIKASINVNFNSIPFEWLGLHYLEEYDPKRALNYLETAVDINPYSAVAIIPLADLLCKEVGEDVGKLFLNYVKNTEMATSWALVPCCYKAGFLNLYNPQKHNNFFSAVENLRVCCFRKPGNRNYKQMVAEAYREYGMHTSSLAFFKDCLKVDSKIDIFCLIMSANEFGLAKKYNKFIRTARLAYYADNRNILTTYTYLSAIVEKAYSLFCANDLKYGLFLAQEGILIASRAICLNETSILLWKALGDLLYICGTASENMVQIYIPAFIYRKDSPINKFECLIASLRCYYVGLRFSEDLSSEFWYSIGLVFYYMRHIFPQEKLKLLNFARLSAEKAIEKRLNWENLNMLGVILYDGNLKQESLQVLECAFKVGYKSFSKEIEMNLGFIYLSQGDIQSSFRSFMYRRGLNTHDEDIWMYFAMLEAASGKPTDGLNYIIYHLYNINSVPSISEWMFFMNIINNTTPNSRKAINYQNLYMQKYENNFYNLIFARSKVPHKIKDLTPLNYYLMGMNSFQYGDFKFALENFHNFIKSLSYNFLYHERYSYAFEQVQDVLNQIKNQSKLEQSPVIDREYIIHTLKAAFTFMEDKMDVSRFWNEEKAVGYTFLDHQKHLLNFIKMAHERTKGSYREGVVLQNFLDSLDIE